MCCTCKSECKEHVQHFEAETGIPNPVANVRYIPLNTAHNHISRRYRNSCHAVSRVGVHLSECHFNVFTKAWTHLLRHRISVQDSVYMANTCFLLHLFCIQVSCQGLKPIRHVTKPELCKVEQKQKYSIHPSKVLATKLRSLSISQYTQAASSE